MGRGTGDETLGTARRRGPASFDPQRAHDSCRVLDPGPLRLADLPQQLREDVDLIDNLEHRFGRIEIEALRFRLVEIPLDVLDEYRLEAPLEEFYARLVESDEEWKAMVAEDEMPGFDFHDAARRHEITKGYVEAFRAGADVLPVVVDFWGLDSMPDVLDGYHRIAAAHESGVSSLLGFELLTD